jgi:hypothetical protein
MKNGRGTAVVAVMVSWVRNAISQLPQNIAAWITYLGGFIFFASTFMAHQNVKQNHCLALLNNKYLNYESRKKVWIFERS